MSLGAAAMIILLAAVSGAQQQDPWKDQADKTKDAVAALERALDLDYGSEGAGSSLLKEGKEHARAVLKKQKQRLAAIEKGRGLAIPAGRAERTRYPTYIKGKAQLFVGGAWKPLQEGFPLAVGDRVRAQDGSIVSLWIAGGFLTLDEKSEARISDQKAVSLNGGRMHWENLAPGADEIQCRTPTVAATIKGTEFDMRVRGGESVFVPFSGVVELRSLTRAVEKGAPRPAGGKSAGTAAPLSAGSKVGFVRGGASIRRGTKVAPASAGVSLAVGDVVTTGPGGAATLELEGGFRVQLAANTSFQVEKRSYSLLEGLAHVRSLVAGGLREDQWGFRTPNAVAAVRGTSFKLAYSNADERDEFIPETGVIEVTAKRSPKLRDSQLWWNKD